MAVLPFLTHSLVEQLRFAITQKYVFLFRPPPKNYARGAEHLAKQQMVDITLTQGCPS